MTLMAFKKNLITLFFLTFLFVFPIKSFAKETPQVVFVNQVRGEGCCSPGTLENLQLQVEKFKIKKMPSFFTIRYDALTDQKYLDYLKKESESNKDIIKIGLLVEITPNLASDSGVKYNGTIERWFEAQSVFTIGYEKEDRRKIIDHLFKTFRDKLGYYPTITSAWMIDTYSLNYIHGKYGVIAHQITREQWGVDSYTLYGGPPHYPYPASTNWSFIPDFEQKNPLLILRQTVTDPLYNYGETKKHFTSQPNDYLNSGLDFEYFKKLINQALFEQKTTGFALLGLENANDLKYQEEYLKQIDYIANLGDRVVFPDLTKLLNYWSNQKTTHYQGKDLINGSDNRAEFETTPDFRKRIRAVEDKTYITDYRYYHRDLSDPYNDYVAKKQGYWIVPYSVDFSHVYNESETIFPETRNDLDIKPSVVLSKWREAIKFNLIDFNKERFEKYPYYLPEPIEREIDRKKSQTKVSLGKTINIEFFTKDVYGYPVDIYYPIEIETDPEIEDIVHQPDGAKHEFFLQNNKPNFQKITLISNKKVIKTIFLFPKFFPFLKLTW